MDLSYMMSLTYMLIKYVALILVLYVLYLVNWLVITPYRTRQFFKKYSNIKMTDKFYPLIGDIALWTENMKNGYGIFHHYIKEVAENPDTDFRLLQLGERVILDVASTKAMDELEKQIPSKIDRGEPKHTATEHIMTASFPLLRSTEDMNKRKKATIDFLGINRASRHIPNMINSVDAYVESLKPGQEVNFSQSIKYVSFENISTHILGEDYKSVNMEFEYVCPETGEVSNISFPDFFIRLSTSELAAYTNPMTKILKPLADRYLIEPYKTNNRNNLYMRKRLFELLQASKDPNSMFKTFMKTGEFNSDDSIMDTISMIFAGFDTTSITVTSLLYFVKANPKIHQKLMDEIRKHKLDRVEEINPGDLLDAFQNCDYLSYVVKEITRYDVPIPITLTYKAYEDTEICGVAIPKGQELIMGIPYVHFNPKEWHRPTELIPERFDPESELFFKPGTKSMRHPKSWNVFSTGKRKCAGQTLAMLSAKVMLVRLLTKLDFDIKHELLDREKACFDMFSGTSLIIKIK